MNLTDNDKHWGPFTFGPWRGSFAIEYLTSGDDDDDDDGDKFTNYLRIIAFGWVIQMWMPPIIPPFRIKHIADSWDEATVARLGRNWYYETFRRSFGFTLSNSADNGYDFLQVHYGAQTHDSRTTKNWSRFIPWKQWNHVRHSIYTPSSEHFYTEELKQWDKFCKMKEQCPKSYFGFEDYDGEMIVATCTIEEREWHKGDGSFKWLRFFSRPKIRRCLDLWFSAEVGPQKGSWKGGTLGHGIDMFPHETPELAFRRYCDMEHERKGRRFRLRFIGPCGAPIKKGATA